MYLVSLYFQDPATLGLQLVGGRPGDPPGHRRAGGGRTLRAAPRGPVRRPSGRRCGVRDHRRRLRLDRLRRRLLEVSGLRPAPRCRRHRDGTLQRPGSSASTASVSAAQVGSASGVSNMARYVGAAVATALAASIYGNVIARPDRRRPVAGRRPVRPASRPPRGRWQSSVSWASRWPWSWVVTVLPRAPWPTRAQRPRPTRTRCLPRPRPPHKESATARGTLGRRSSFSRAPSRRRRP